MSQGKSFTNGPVFVKHRVAHKDAVPVLHSLNKALFGCIVRSNNGNVVCYEAVRGTDGLLDVDVYWMLADPEQGAAWRKKHGHDREELSKAERMRAYGATVSHRAADSLRLTIAAVPEKVITVKLKKGKARAMVTLNGQKCLLDTIEVQLVGVVTGVVKGGGTVTVSGRNQDKCTVSEVIRK